MHAGYADWRCGAGHTDETVIWIRHAQPTQRGQLVLEAPDQPGTTQTGLDNFEARSAPQPILLGLVVRSFNHERGLVSSFRLSSHSRPIQN
jgi:hypothetical protein